MKPIDFNKPFVNVSFTQKWWENVCNDEEKLKKFLIKLYRTELDGYKDNLAIIDNWCDKDGTEDKLAKRILCSTAKDEWNHASLLAYIIIDRGWEIPTNLADVEPSLYWDYMEKAIVDLKTACAVCYFGEKLAADKFAVMLEMECTPDDVRAFLEEALPDESYHATSFKHLATDEVVGEMYDHHKKALDLILTGKMKES